MTDQATLLRRYHMALSEARTLGSLRTEHAKFWDANTFVGAVVNALDDIWLAHRERVAGRGSPALCDDALNAALKEIAGQ